MLSWVPSWLRRTFAVLVLALVVWWLVIPQFGSAEDALDTIRRIDPVSIAIAVALVGGSFVAQAEMTRRVLPPEERPSLFDMVRIELSAAAVSHTVPGGTAAGTALGFRLLTRAGVDGSDAGFAAGVRGVGSSLVLNALLWLALLAWIPSNGVTSRLGVAGLVGAVLLLVVGLVVLAAFKARAATTRLLVAIVRPLPLLDHERVPDVVEQVADRIADLAGRPRLALRVGAWGAVHWLAEAASLWLLLRAFGASVDPISLFVAFGVVNVLAAIPVTPRGLGILEAVLIPTLVSFGTPTSVATLGVISWRLLSFWLPIPAGALAYVSIRLRGPDVTGEPSVERHEITAELAEARRVGDGRS